MLRDAVPTGPGRGDNQRIMAGFIPVCAADAPARTRRPIPPSRIIPATRAEGHGENSPLLLCGGFLPVPGFAGPAGQYSLIKPVSRRMPDGHMAECRKGSPLIRNSFWFDLKPRRRPIQSRQPEAVVKTDPSSFNFSISTSNCSAAYGPQFFTMNGSGSTAPSPEWIRPSGIFQNSHGCM